MDNSTTVLIADNSEEFCNQLTAALQRSQRFQVVGTVGDGEHVLRKVAELRPEVLVLDLMLPKRDGLSILKAMASLDHKPAVLATSGFVTDYVASAAAGLGVRYLMLKPCDCETLVERLEELRGGEPRSVACCGGEINPVSKPWSPTSSTRSVYRLILRAISISEKPSSLPSTTWM